jgi:hypothetical protein
MPWIQLPNGVSAHVRMAKTPRRRCTGSEGTYACPTPATHQCDYLVDAGQVCNAWICAAHATSVGADLDHCPAHASARQGGLFTGLQE